MHVDIVFFFIIIHGRPRAFEPSLSGQCERWMSSGHAIEGQIPPGGEARLYPLHVTTTERAKPLPGDRRTPARRACVNPVSRATIGRSKFRLHRLARRLPDRLGGCSACEACATSGCAIKPRQTSAGVKPASDNATCLFKIRILPTPGRGDHLPGETRARLKINGLLWCLAANMIAGSANTPSNRANRCIGKL
jgi:hypothetical protein